MTLPKRPLARVNPRFMILPNEDNERLICLASSKFTPSAPVLATFSDPAKSTR